jgi:hypothetical protein
MSKGIIKVCAGDFAANSVGAITYTDSFLRNKPCAISLKVAGRFLRESIPVHNLVRVEIVAQDNVGRSGNMILRGAVGAALLGPVGAIVGAATTSRRQTEVMFRADFNDGRTLLATADFESFTCLKSAAFAVEQSGTGKPAAQPTQVEWRSPRTKIGDATKRQIFLLVGGPIALVTLFALIGGGTKPVVQPTLVVKAATPIVVPDGCDLAGAIPNCKAVMAELAAKGVKGTGHRMDAAEPAEHASWQDKPIMSDAEWANFQKQVQQSQDRFDDANRAVDLSNRIVKDAQARAEGRPIDWGGRALR